MKQNPNLNHRGPGRPDTVGHSSVQAWSAGPIFPAVIAVIERRAPVYFRGAPFGDGFEDPSISFELTIGAFREEYATREDAELVARWTCADGRIIPERYSALVRVCE